MSTTDTKTMDTADREIVITRVFAAPRELVWQAMTDPQHVIHWWGPRGFTTRIEEMDVRPGGVWKHIMRGPDGTEYPNKSIFKEVTKPARIAFSHGGARKGGPGANFEATWSFETEGDKTRVTMRMVFPSAEQRDIVVKEYNAVEGGKQTFERLGEHLIEMAEVAAADPRDFVVTRILSAPRELVWKMWTEPKHLAQWWGPHQFTNPACDVDLRVGGAYRIVMRGPDGGEYPLKGIYREIVAPERLVMTADHSELPDAWHDLANPNRDKSKPRSLEAITTMTLEKLDGKTKLTVRMRFETAAIRTSMGKLGMNEGWSQTLERLDIELAKF